MKDKILVLISTYNGEKSLKTQLESIYAQTIIDKVDILVRDDGSKDNTCAILEQYNHKENFSYIKGENVGYNASFLTLLNTAGNYKYYAFCDQDDIWFPNKLESAYQKLEECNDNLPLLYGSCTQLESGEGEVLGVTQQKRREFGLNNVLFQNILPGHTQVLNFKLKELLNKPMDYKNIHVYDSFVTLCACCFGKIIFDNNVYTHYIQHSGNSYGYGNGIVDWIKIRIARMKKGETKSFKSQNKMFLDLFMDALNMEQLDIIINTVKDKNFIQRIRYILKYKPCRQKVFETFLLYILILQNKY